jgi:uncharacterized membrane protein HdeD (DUF308 family)
MSGLISPLNPPGLDKQRYPASKWGWFVGLGAFLLLTGMFALIDTVAVTLISVMFIGAMVLVSGAFQIFHAFQNKSWSGFGFNILCGILYVVGGFLIMAEPITGSVVLTFLLLLALGVAGVLRIVMGLQHRELKLWWLLVLSGAVSLLLSVLLVAALPWSGLWVLGTLIAVELIFQGVAWLQFGLALRRRTA